jgi:hypothetical protein
MMLWLSGEANVSGKRHKISIRIESLNKDLQNLYSTMWVVAKESLDLLTDFPLQQEPYPRFCIKHHPIFNP